MDALMAIQQDVSLELNQQKLGKVFKTIIDRKENDYYVGRTEYDSPEVDNEVIIRDTGEILKPGSFHHVIVDKAEDFDLFGSVVNP